MKPRRYPLRYSLPFALLIGATLIGAANFILNLHIAKTETDNRAKREVLELYHLRNDLELALQQGDNAHVQQAIAELGSDTDILNSYFVADNGLIIASTDLSAVGNLFSPPAIFSDIPDGLSPAILNAENRLYSRFPISLARKFDELRSTRVGYLYIETDLTRRQAASQRTIEIQTATFAGFTILLSLALWAYFHNLIGKRINHLQATAEQFGRGFLKTRAALTEGDEIGNLAKSFNMMAARIENQQEDLHALRQALDEHAIVSIADLNGNITYVNDRFCQVSGYSRSELLGNNHRIVKSQSHDHDFYENLWQTISHGNIWQGLFENRRKNGSPYWVQSTIVPILDENNLPKQYISVRTDVTQRERIRQAMKQLAITAPNENVFEAIAHSVCVGLDCRWAGIGRLLPGGKQVETLGFWNDGHVGEKFSYTLDNTPCREVCSKEVPVIITDGVIAAYPNDHILSELSAMSYRGVPLLHEDGSLYGVLFAIDDKSCEEDEADNAFMRLAAERATLEIKRAEFEQTIKHNEQLLSAAQSMAKLGSWTLDFDTNELIWSDEVFRIFELDKSRFKASYDYFLDSIHPDDRDTVNQAYQRSIDEHSPYSIIHRLLLKDGRIKWVHERGETYYDDAGKPIKSIGYVHDISDLRKTENEKEFLTQGAIIAAETYSFNEGLQRSLELVCNYTGWQVGHAYRIDHDKQLCVPLEVWSFTNESEHVEFRQTTDNFFFEKGIGLPGRVWVTRKPEWIHNIQTHANFPRAKACSDLTLKGAFGLPIEIDGRIEAVLEFFDPLTFSPDRELESSLVLFSEQIGRIFERHIKGEEKLRLQNQLLQANKMESIGQLTGGIAHDFNNMLASILGYTELAITRYASDPESKLAEYLKQVQSSGERARDLVSQLLTFSRTQNILLTKLSVPDLVEEATKMLRPMLPSSIEIKLDVENNLPPIMGNAVQLQQVLTNLLINARDAMEGHGLLTVEIRTRDRFNVCTSCHKTISGQFVELTVRDNGSGMAEDLVSRIFEPFMTTKDIGKGSGMGLSIVHGIVHAHGGHILVDSALNKYTAFHVLFPAANTQSPETIDSTETTNSPIETTRKISHILIVDDEPTVAGFLSEFLEGKGYKVTALNDSAQALGKFTEDPHFFDLVLTDQTMPRMTGAEMAKAMLDLRADMPIILCTGYSELIDEARAKSLGIQGYMLKPVHSTKLLDMVESLLTQSQLQTF